MKLIIKVRKLSLEWKFPIWNNIHKINILTLGPAYGDFGYNENPAATSNYLLSS